MALPPEELVQRRLEKYSRMGKWVEKPSKTP